MSREIKFRFWVTRPPQSFMRYSTSFMAKDLVEEDGWIVMQYTNLKDKNGKEIYEGDVLSDSISRVGEVEFYMGAFIVKEINGQGILSRYTKDFEVIGNIYENPAEINNTYLAKA